MVSPRSTSTQFAFAPLVLCSLVVLSRASVLGGSSPPSNSGTLQENCSNSTPGFPPSVTMPLTLFFWRYSVFIGISQDGQVKGWSKERNDTKLQRESVGPCLNRIKSISTGRYLAMNSTSKVYTQTQPNRDAVFRFHFDSVGFVTLQSYQYGWYVGLKKNLRPRKGKRVRLSNKEGKFWIDTPGRKPLSL